MVYSPAKYAQNKAGKIDQLIKSYFNAEKFMGTVLVAENELNRAGYDLLAQKKISGAVGIFKLMTEEFPMSENAFDSLAEGYMIMGDKENAVKYHQKSIELDPKNINASEMLKKLKTI